MRRLALPALAPLAVIAAGCGSQDVRPAPTFRAAPVFHPDARADAATTFRDWRVELEFQARRRPAVRFPSPPRRVLAARVALMAKRYRLTVVGVRVLHPRGQAPVVIVRGPHPARIAAATHAILQVIDPKRRTGDDRTGWAYEGFFYEAEDTGGVPFLAVFNTWRGRAGGSDRGGGQWASRPGLYPFAHG